jgi:GDP-4-dehydro-6-deoxy-D-mannose reductase
VLSLVERFLELAGVEAEIQNDPTRFRPSIQPRVCGDHAKMARDTGWEPEVPMDETLLNFYHYWEHEIGKSK